MSNNPLLAGLSPVHPGEIIAEIIDSPDFPHSKVAVAEALGINRAGLYKLLDGKNGVTAQMALRLERVLGSSAAFWMQLQANHDLRVARDTLGAIIAGLPRLSPVMVAGEDLEKGDAVVLDKPEDGAGVVRARRA